MKRTSTFTKAEIANQNNIKVDNKVTKANLINEVTGVLHPRCNVAEHIDIKDYLNIVIAYGHKVTEKKHGGFAFKVGRTTVAEMYVCVDGLIHIYVRDENAVHELEKVVKAYHTINEKWVIQNRFEFTKDSFVDFVLSDNLHILTDLF